jgi:hypothetical protein
MKGLSAGLTRTTDMHTYMLPPVTGGAVTVTGGAVTVTGGAVTVTGGAVTLTGGAVTVTGGTVTVNIASRRSLASRVAAGDRAGRDGANLTVTTKWITHVTVHNTVRTGGTLSLYIYICMYVYMYVYIYICIYNGSFDGHAYTHAYAGDRAGLDGANLTVTTKWLKSHTTGGAGFTHVTVHNTVRTGGTI